MSKNKVIKSVSFNKTNEKDERILKAISRRNFSGYVKKLILADLDAKQGNQDQNEHVLKKAETTAEKLARLKTRNSNDNQK